MQPHADRTGIEFVCPCCRAALSKASAAYRCAGCGRSYPVLFGIADFRLRSDRYLSLDEERAKARRLHEFGQGASFDALVRHYYAITDDVPDDLALRYRDYIRDAPRRARAVVDELDPRRGTDTLVDLGCGSGGLLIAADGRYRAAFGVDIALRWLVICQKRLAEEGVRATLVCADVEALPFPDTCLSHAVAADLVEHVYDVGRSIGAIARHLEPGGRLWLSAANRYCVGPHASTRVWGIGFLPKPARRRVLLGLKGIDLLRHANLVSPGGLTRLLRARGFTAIAARPKPVAPGAGAAGSQVERALIGLYRRALRVRATRRLLLRIGPAFEIVCRKADAVHAAGGR